VTAWAGGVVMLYEGGRGAGVGIAREGVYGFERVADGPWVSPLVFEDPVNWRGIERIGSPFALDRGGVLYAYLTVRGVEGSNAVEKPNHAYPADANDSIGLASTRDLRNAEVFAAGPVFARRTNFRAYLGEAEPAVMVDAEASWLMYTSSDATGEQRIGVGLATTRP